MDHEIRLEGGKLVLLRRNGIWQARIAIGNRRYLWKSLKTANEAEATRAATKLFHRTEHKLEEGLPVQSRSLSSVLEEYETYRERDQKLAKPRNVAQALSTRAISWFDRSSAYRSFGTNMLARSPLRRSTTKYCATISRGGKSTTTRKKTSIRTPNSIPRIRRCSGN